MSSEDALERLFSLHPKLIDLSLGRMQRLLAALGQPEQHLPPVIHIAGTNGKGSTLSFFRALLEAGGNQIQAYTSPHLVRFHERIRLSDGLITEAALQQVLDDVERVNDGEAITFFEATTAVALAAFAKDEAADFCLLEVGLGGRFDATNVIDAPAACIITPVAMDHEHFLGNRLDGIAGEKAGILKPGVPAFIAGQQPEAQAVIEEEAEKVGAPLFVAGRDWRVSLSDGGFVFEDAQGVAELPMPALSGAHQMHNAGVALACLRHLGQCTDAAAKKGMARVSWPARLQPLTEGPLADIRDGKGSLRLDGGHNEHAAQAVVEYLAGRKVHVVMGLMANRAPEPLLGIVSDIAQSFTFVPIDGEEAHTPDTLIEAAEGMGLQASKAKSISSALQALPEGDCLIFGSLYLAGQVLAQSGLAPQ